MMLNEFWQNQFYMIGSVTLLLLGIACVVYIVDKVVKSLRALCSGFVREVLQEVGKDQQLPETPVQ